METANRWIVHSFRVKSEQADRTTFFRTSGGGSLQSWALWCNNENNFRRFKRAVITRRKSARGDVWGTMRTKRFVSDENTRTWIHIMLRKNKYKRTQSCYYLLAFKPIAFQQHHHVPNKLKKWVLLAKSSLQSHQTRGTRDVLLYFFQCAQDLSSGDHGKVGDWEWNARACDVCALFLLWS